MRSATISRRNRLRSSALSWICKVFDWFIDEVYTKLSGLGVGARRCSFIEAEDCAALQHSIESCVASLQLMQ